MTLIFCKSSRYGKSLAFFACCQQLSFHRFFVFVLRQVELVDASVRLGQPILISGVKHSDCEFLDAILTAQSFKALNWNLTAACHELDELCTFTVVKLSECFPEKQDWL